MALPRILNIQVALCATCESLQRWRGPSGQGLAMGSGYVDKWSDTGNVKWKTKLETTGNGSPIVWANRIFITIGSADGTKRGIAAFDRANGRKLWETYSPDTNFEQVNLKNGYGKPVENVYTSKWEGNVLVTTIATAAPNPMIEKRSIEADGTMRVERTIILPGNKPETVAQVFRKIG